MSELRGLGWAEFDLDASPPALKVRRRADRYNRRGAVKSKAARRTIVLSPEHARLLREWRLVCPRNKDRVLDLVFPTGVGTVETGGNIWNRVWRPLLARAEVGKRYNLHSLRHAAVWLRIQEGWPPKQIQAFCGHSRITTTLDTYGGWWPDDLADQAAATRIERQLLG